MRKLITIIMILALFPPAAALAGDYTPALGMNMRDFILKYNAIEAPLGSPYVQLSTTVASDWTYFNYHWCAWLYPENTRRVAMILMTKDPFGGKDFVSGLDTVQLYAASAEDLIPLISLAIRCSRLFSAELLSVSTSSFCVADVIQYFFENNLKEQGMLAYKQLDAESDYCISLFYSDGYYFQISTQEAFQ